MCLNESPKKHQNSPRVETQKRNQPHALHILSRTFILQHNFLVVKYPLTLLTDFPCTVIQNVKEIKTSHGECQTFRARLARTGKKNAGTKFRLNHYDIYILSIWTGYYQFLKIKTAAGKLRKITENHQTDENTLTFLYMQMAVNSSSGLVNNFYSERTGFEEQEEQEEEEQV